MDDIFIYAMKCPISNEIRYIGKTSQKLKFRLRAHILTSKKEFNHKANWIKSLKEKGLIPNIEILEICNKKEWIEKEKYWINFYRLTKNNLTNMTDGGDGICSYVHTENTKKKISIASKKFIRTKEWSYKLSESKIGNKNPMKKLSYDDIKEIFWIADAKLMTQIEIASMYKICQSHVSRIISGDYVNRVKFNTSIVRNYHAT